jgi:hypothetical protein
MRACKQCGLSIGDTAAFCPVCGTIADPEDVSPATPAPPESAPSDQATRGARGAVAATGAEPEPPANSEEAQSQDEATPPAPVTASGLESAARASEKTDPARAAALYRQAVVAFLESDDDPLGDPSARRDVQRVFDRLSLVLKREGRLDEALEEIDSAAYLGLVDDDGCGTKAQREALMKRRDALRRAVAKTAAGK